MGASIEEIVGRLEGVKRSGKGYIARCPSHEDHKQSLSINEGDKGITLKCFTGCSFSEIVAALNLKESDLFYEAKVEKQPEIAATYDYSDESGDLLYQVVRYRPKGFRQRRPTLNTMGGIGWTWNLEGVRRVPYGLPELLDAILANRRVFFVEGEKDAEALQSLGFAATCICGGAQAWRTTYAEFFEDANVVIMPDNDKPGHAFAETVAQSMSATARSVKVLHLPNLGPVLPKHGLDVSDWLKMGGTAGELQDLIVNPPLPEGCIRLSEALAEVVQYANPATPMPPGIQYPWKQINYLTRGLRPGWLCYLAGYTRHGKTAAAMEFALKVAAGGRRVLFISMEMAATELGVRTAQRFGLNTDSFYQGRPHVNDFEAAQLAQQFDQHRHVIINGASDVHSIATLTEQIKPDILIIDYMQLLDIGNNTRVEGTNQNSRALKIMAQKLAVPTLCLSQLSRPEKHAKPRPPVLHDLRDSGALENDGDQVIFVYREGDDFNNPTEEGMFIVPKSRFGNTGYEEFRFDGVMQQFRCVVPPKAVPIYSAIDQNDAKTWRK